MLLRTMTYRTITTHIKNKNRAESSIRCLTTRAAISLVRIKGSHDSVRCFSRLILGIFKDEISSDFVGSEIYSRTPI